MQSTRTTSADLRIDAPIFTADGRHLGVVKEIRRSAFKVDAPMARDYWLPCDAVTSADAHRVTLSVDEDDVDDLKRGEPGQQSTPEEYRSRNYDETWRGTRTDYPGPDYLDAGRNWERSPREPAFSYGQWQSNRDPNEGRYDWEQPREPFFRDSDPRGYRQARDPRTSGWSELGAYGGGTRGEGSRAAMNRGSRFSGSDRQGSDYQGRPGWYSQPRYTGQFGRNYSDESPWSDSEAPSGFSGRGPRSYNRPDDSICDEVCERLTDAGNIDATNVDVRVKNGEVILTGEVWDRTQRRIAEDIALGVGGVRDVRNELHASGSRRDEAPTYLV